MEAIKELRSLAHSMMPPPFENNEFENILRDLAETINLAGKIKFTLSLPTSKELEKMDNHIKLCFYRIIQEQVSNILKYAKAKNARVRIDVTEREYCLCIEDDGLGFDTVKRPGGIGLKNMESRCRLFNGTMYLETAPGKGCRVKVQLPINSEVYSKLDD